MKLLSLTLVLAAAMSAGAAGAAEGPQQAPAPRQALVCRWEATQQSGIPIRLCLTRRQWAARTAYTQQWIREFQARSFVKM